MEDLGYEENKESLANEDPQAHPDHLDREETQAHQEAVVRQDPRGLRAAMDQGEGLELLVNLETMAPQDSPDQMDHLVPLENLDSVAKTAHRVYQALLVPQGQEAERVQKDSLARVDWMAQQDRVEGLDREVLLVTEDQKERRVSQEKMVATVNGDL